MTSIPHVAELPNDTGHAARFGLIVLILGFGGFLLWAAFAPLDEGVPCSGLVAIDTKRKAVQHLTGGIVTEVLVREGDQIQEGQVLLKIDEAVSKANFEAARQRYMGLKAMENRLLAEQRGLNKIAFDRELLKLATNPLIQQHIHAQEQLLQSRRSALHAELQVIQENIASQKGTIASLQQMQVQRKTQLNLFKEELGQIRDLVKEGYVPRKQQIELERSIADTSAVLADIQGNIQRATMAIKQLQQQITAKEHEFRQDVDTQLAEVRREVQADAERYQATMNDLVRTKIKAPVSGQVVGLVAQTVGGIIQPGQKLMDIVPEKQELLIETRIPPHVIDRVHNGLAADIRFSAFAHSPQLVVDGKIKSVSGDLLSEQTVQGMVSYFLARIEVTPEGITKLGDRELQPGMPAEVVIKTGERSLLTYLLHPLLKRIAVSMKEE